MSGTRRTDSNRQSSREPGGEAGHGKVQPSRRGLLAGAAAALGSGGLPVVAAAAPGADADIIAVCDRYVAAELEWQRLLYIGDAAGTEDVANAFAADVRADAMDAVADLPPATTMAGLRAKARAVVAFYDPDPPDSGCVLDDQLWEVLLALTGPELPAQLQRQRPVRSEAES